MVVLPDYITGIQSQISTFLSWGSVSQLVQIVIGVSVGTVVLGMFLTVFLRK